jgi:ADP-heptose:LPS heptosyltransferase
LTSKARVLHKDAGCSICLAHECRKNFLCLQQINVEEVVKAAEELLEV